MAVLDRLNREHTGDALKVIGLAVGEAPETVRRFLSEHPVSYPVAIVDAATADKFAAGRFPTHVVIDAEGNIASHDTGAGGEERIIELLEKAGMKASASAKSGSRRDGATVRNEP
jgi:hypothetical protein